MSIACKEDLLKCREEAQKDRFRRYEETHFQKAYSLEEVQRALLEAGMAVEACYDAFTHEPPRKDSERVYVIAREQGKEDPGRKNEKEGKKNV